MKLAPPEQRVQTVCVLILSAIALGATLYFLRSVLIPFVLALFFSIVLGPIMDFQVRRLHMPRTLAVIGTLVLSFVVLIGVWLLVSTSVDQLSHNAEDYRLQIVQTWDSVSAWLRDFFRLENDAEGGIGGDQLKQQLGTSLLSLVDSIVSILSQGVVVLIFVVFLLIGRRTDAPTTGVWAEIEAQVTSYLTIKVFISAIVGILVGSILTALSVPLAMVFGLFACLLNFIPNVGSVISILLPLPVVLMTPGLSSTTQFMAIAMPAVVGFMVGNVLEPKLMGKSLDLHPVAILFALIFWGILWGIIGVLLAVPITAVLKILFERLGLLEPVAALMAGRSQVGRGRRSGDEGAATG